MRGGKPYAAECLNEMQVVPGAAADLRLLKERGFLLIVITNQPDVRRGTQTQAAVDGMNDLLRQELPLDDVFVCFHDDFDECDCRKPRPGLLLRASAKYGIDCRRSFMIGDRWRDVDAGHAAGCTAVLIDYQYAERPPASEPDTRVTNLKEAVQWILSRS